MNKFAFLIHPLDMRDVVRVEPKAAGKRMPLVEKIFDWMPCQISSHITGVQSVTGARAEGWFILVPMMPRQFVAYPRDKVLDRIITGARIGEAEGAQIIGLGGYTSVAGDAGITVANSVNVAVTSGNAYTIACALEGALEGARRMNIDLRRATTTIIGASGSIGSVCAHVLAKEVGALSLIARNVPRLQRIAQSIHDETGVKADIFTEIPAGVRHADIVITATSSTGNIIQAHHLKPGALVCDVSLPHDTSREVAEQRPDVLVIEGGLVEVPGDVEFNYDFGYPPKVSLACMAETMILALEGRFENFSLGRGIRREQVEEIAWLAKRHGFRLAGFRSFDRMVTDDDILSVQTEAKERLKNRTYSISEAV